MSENNASLKSHLAEWFLQPLRAQTNRPYLWFFDNSRAKPLALKEAGEWVSAYTRGLDALSLARGARIISLGQPAPLLWLAGIGHALQGLINVAIPNSLPSAEQMRLIYNSKAACLLVDSGETLRALCDITEFPSELSTIIVLQPKRADWPASPHQRLLSIDDVLHMGRPLPDRTSQKLALCQPDDTASILCFPTTEDDIGLDESSSTVMKRTHAEWGQTYKQMTGLFQQAGVTLENETILVIGDWHNPGAYAATHIFPIQAANALGFLPPNAPVLDALNRMQPSLVVANGQALEKIKDELHAEIENQADWFEKLLYRQALRMGKISYESPHKNRGWRKFYAHLLQDVFIKAFTKRLGGHLKTILSVDENTPYATHLFFYSFGIHLVEVPSAFEKQFEKRNW